MLTLTTLDRPRSRCRARDGTAADVEGAEEGAPIDFTGNAAYEVILQRTLGTSCDI